MPVRAAMLIDDGTWGPGERGQTARLAALTQGRALGGGSLAELRTLPGGRHPVRTVLALATYRPELVIAPQAGLAALLATVYRMVAPWSRLMLQPGTGRRRGMIGRMAMRRADAVLAEEDAAGEDTGEVAAEMGPRTFWLSAPSGLELFLALRLSRGEEAAHRIACVGPLSPSSGVADVLLCLAAWAERNPARTVELWWIGEGDLAGVLDAQPLPENLRQRFLGALGGPARAQAFGECGLAVLPVRSRAGRGVAEARAAGLVTISAAGSQPTQRDDGLGWTYDPARPQALAQALTAALDVPVPELDRMREAVRETVRAAERLETADRWRAVLAAVVPLPVTAPARTMAAGPR